MMLRCEISSDGDTLNELWQQYKWLPNAMQVRPNPEIMQVKEISMSVVQNSWLSPRDYILYKIFGKPMIVENEKFLVDPTDLLLNAKDRIFRANDYPYQIDEGNHWVLWYCDIKQMFDSDTITRHIDEDIRRLVDNYMYCDEVAKVELDKQGNNIFVKQQIAYYKKNDATEKILVKVVGVHFDDFPNIYYTIQPCDPSSATFDEKQTDANRLSLADGALQNTQLTVEERPVRYNFAWSVYSPLSLFLADSLYFLFLFYSCPVLSGILTRK